MTAELEALLVDVQAQSDHNQAERRRLSEKEAQLQGAFKAEAEVAQATIKVRELERLGSGGGGEF